MKFSQRIGVTPSTKTIQVEDIDNELRNGLWNALKIYFIDPLEKYSQYVYSGHIDPPFRLIDPLAGGNIPEGQPKNELQ
jgi:hypothetical protein